MSKKMKVVSAAGKLTRGLVVLLIVAASAGAARAEVRRVTMRIDGYLCGN